MEPGAETIQQRQGKSVQVDGGRRLGVCIDNNEGFFDLNALFHPDAFYYGSSKVSHIYIRSSDGNIYRLDDKGSLVDLNGSHELGALVESTIPLQQPFTAEQGRLVIGRSSGLLKDRAARISEVVAVGGKLFDSDDLQFFSSGRVNAIVDEFRSRLPDAVRDVDPYLSEVDTIPVAIPWSPEKDTNVLTSNTHVAAK
jgi:hypothetical protein